MGKTMALKDAHILIFMTCECYLIWQKGICRLDYVKDPGAARLSWIMWVDSLNESEIYKYRKTSEDAMLLALKVKEGTTGQGILMAPRSW